jgi:hypothetical protein
VVETFSDSFGTDGYEQCGRIVFESEDNLLEKASEVVRLIDQEYTMTFRTWIGGRMTFTGTTYYYRSLGNPKRVAIKVEAMCFCIAKNSSSGTRS